MIEQPQRLARTLPEATLSCFRTSFMTLHAILEVCFEQMTTDERRDAAAAGGQPGQGSEVETERAGEGRFFYFWGGA